MLDICCIQTRGCVRTDRFLKKLPLHSVTRKLCPLCVGAVEELQLQVSQSFHSCIGFASNEILGFHESSGLLIYGRAKTKLVLASNIPFLLFSRLATRLSLVNTRHRAEDFMTSTENRETCGKSSCSPATSK